MPAALLLAFALAVPPPPATASEQWRQLGAAARSRPGKQLHFVRTADYPSTLAIVVTSTSTRPIRVFWWSYCEFESDDGTTEQHQQVLTGLHKVIAYPPVFSGATRCYVSVNAGAHRRAVVSGAVFAGTEQ